MKKQGILIILFAVLAAFLIFFNLANKPVTQNLKDSYISVKAPKLEKNTINELAAKENIKDNVTEILFYQSKSGDIAYLVTYAQYPKEVDLEKGIKSVINMFKNKSFSYSTEDNEVSGNEGKYISGTFTENRKKYGIKNQLIKKDNSFWQILVLYPDTKRNEKKATSFINSIEITK